MRVFITGGAGFIGSRLVSALAGRGAACCVFDNLHPQVHGPDASAPRLPDGSWFVRGDVADPQTLTSALVEFAPDVIFHLAAETGTGQSMDEVARYCRANVMGTAYLIEAMRAAQAPPLRLVLASSRAIYGEGAYATDDGRTVAPPPRTVEDMAAGRFLPRIEGGKSLTPAPTREELPPTPSSVYASTKLMQEHLVLQTGAGAPWTTAILRFQNVYGAGQSLNNPYTGVLSIFTQILLNGGDLDIYEDGAITRDFVHVDDVVLALLLAGEVGRPPVLANIGSGEPITILEAARALGEAVGRSGDFTHVSGRFRPGDVRHAVADITKARELLGWRPETPFEAGIRGLVDWARSS
jgi:dTDP-L-rhamnose 4-epimerase